MKKLNNFKCLTPFILGVILIVGCSLTEVATGPAGALGSTDNLDKNHGDLPELSSIPTEGLIGYYPFNGNANDESGNNYHGTVNGATLTTDRFGNEGNAYEFNGVDDFINVGDHFNFDFDSSFSISAWVKTDKSTGLQNIFGKVDYSWESTEFYCLSVHGSYARGVVRDTVGHDINAVGSTTYVSDNVWYHIAMTYDGKTDSTLNVYVDGIFEVSGTKSGNPITMVTSDPALIGAYRFGRFLNFFDGSIDELRIYNQALSEDDIKDLADIATVRGLVTDERGKALEHVTVGVFGTEEFRDGEWVRVIRTGLMSRYSTDKEGRFALPFYRKDIRHDVWFDCPGFAPTFLYAISAESKELKVVMRRGTWVTGTVTRLVKGRLEPVSGVMVELQLPTEDRWYQHQAITDREGKYTLCVSPPPGDNKWRVVFLNELVELDVKDAEPVIGPDFVVMVQVREK